MLPLERRAYFSPLLQLRMLFEQPLTIESTLNLCVSMQLTVLQQSQLERVTGTTIRTSGLLQSYRITTSFAGRVLKFLAEADWTVLV